MFIITLDMSRSPESILASLNKWFMKTASYISDYYYKGLEKEGKNFSEIQKIRSNTLNYVKNARITRGNGENLTDDLDAEEFGVVEEIGILIFRVSCIFYFIFYFTFLLKWMGRRKVRMK
jgi:hypothetical protein